VSKHLRVHFIIIDTDLWFGHLPTYTILEELLEDDVDEDEMGKRA